MNVEISTIALFLQFVSLIVGAVWVVGKIRTTTEVLNNTISNLGKTIERLEVTLLKIETQYISHEVRIAKIEQYIKMGQ